MIDLKTFTPAEAAKISGVNVTLQRDWRRREILPRKEGHARFSPFEVAELMALNALAAQGLGPQRYTPVASMMAAGIIAAALEYREAYEGPLDLIVNGEEPEFLDEWESRAKTYPQWKWDYDVTDWRLRGLKKRILQREGHDTGAVRGCFIQWADGSFAFYHSPITPYETVDQTDPRRNGAVIILDLSALGAAFASRAPGFAMIDRYYAERENANSRLYRRFKEIEGRLSARAAS